LPCEVGVKVVLPAIRALMARTIVEKHGMKERQAAEILGLSQSAISRYTSKQRKHHNNRKRTRSANTHRSNDKPAHAQRTSKERDSGTLLPNMHNNSRKRVDM
jgi:predicted transcriptional regulator